MAYGCMCVKGVHACVGFGQYVAARFAWGRLAG